MSKIFHFIAYFWLMFCVSVSAYASGSKQEAENYVRSMADKAVYILHDDNLDEKQQEQAIADMFYDVVDIHWISKFAVGRHWRALEQEKRDEYVKHSAAVLFQKYLPDIKKLVNHDVVYAGTKQISDDEYSVKTVWTDRNDGEVTVNVFKLRQLADNELTIFDVISNGISLINIQRLEYNSVLNRRGLDYFLYKVSVKGARGGEYFTAYY